MSEHPTTSVVVAVKGNTRNLYRILEALSDYSEHNAELVFAIAGEAPAALKQLGVNAKISIAAADTLVPFLWRDGIRAASGRRVALLTTECIPDRNWLARVAATDIDKFAGIGGALVNDEASDGRNWAVYLLRYLRFAPPAQRAVVDDIAADNAVYDRDAILRNAELLEEGFWEPSFHARFIAAGRKLLFDPQILVTHSGTNEAGAFMRHRFSHGHEYGSARAGREGRGKALMLLLASPLLPALMLARIVSRSAKKGLVAPMLKSSPFLLLFALAWAAGESTGYLSALTGRAKSEHVA